MTLNSARRWLILGSLIVTAAHFIFFLIAPAVGYPLEYEDSIRLLQISIPVFFGYLGSASRFVFGTNERSEKDGAVAKKPLMGLMVRGPLIVFSLVSAASLFAFAYSNRVNAEPGIGMDVDKLATIETTALGLLAVTTNVAVSTLFNDVRKDKQNGSEDHHD